MSTDSAGQAHAIPRVFIAKPDDETSPPPSIEAALTELGFRRIAELHGLPVRSISDSLLLLLRYVCESELGFLVSGFSGGDVVLTPAPVVEAPPPPRDPSRPLDSFDLSIRAVHCAKALGLATVGDLAAMTQEELLDQRNVGRKTVAELRSLLEDFGSDFGSVSLGRTMPGASDLPGSEQTGIAETANTAVPKDFSEWAIPADLDHRHINVALLVRIQDMPLSVRAINWTTKKGLVYLSDLVCQTRSGMKDWKNLGRKTLDEIEGVLTSVGLRLGSQVPAWILPHMERLVDFFQSFGANTPNIPTDIKLDDLGGEDLEGEIAALLRSSVSERDAKIASRALGWDGRGGTTLEEAGAEFGLTRERIRQILLRARDHVHRAFVSTPWITKAIAFVEEHTPALAQDIETALVTAGICRSAFRIEGVAQIGEARGATPPWTILRLGSVRAVFRKGTEELAIRIGQAASRQVEHFGVGETVRLATEIQAQFPDATAEAIRRLLPCIEDSVRWLDPEKTWFWSASPKRNRLLNRAGKALYVARDLPLDVLYDAVFRDARVQDSIVPKSVFMSLCSQISWCDVRDGHVSLSGPLAETDLSPNEETLVRILRAHGSVLPRAELEVLSQSAGIGDAAFNGILSNSPVLVNHGDQWYGTVGSERPERLLRFEPSHPRSATSEVAGCLLGAGELDSPFFPCAVATSLLGHAEMRGVLACRWSICELKLGTDDLELVRRWGQTAPVSERFLAKQSIRYGDHHLSGTECMALLFLVFCVNVASTEAAEGEMWPEIMSALGSKARGALAFRTFLPRVWLREATESVCRKLNIRHVFGKEGSQSWLRTVFLQFGITSSGWRRLPAWLAGQSVPTTVSDLLDPDNENYSVEFERLWHLLRAGASQELSEELSTNPWVPPDRSNWILELADSDRADLCADADDEGPVTLDAIFENPRLRWVGGRPKFGILPRRTPFVSLCHRRVRVTFDEVGSILRFDEEGIPAFDPEAPMLEPSAAFVRVDAPELEQSTFIAILDVDEELAIFELDTGRKLDPWSPRLREGRAYAILCRADVTLTPAPPEWHRILGGDAILYSYRTGLPDEVVADLGCDTIWSLSEARALDRALTGGYLSCSGGEWGSEAKIELHLQPSIAVKRIRVGSQAVLFRNREPVLYLKPGVDYSRITKAELHGTVDGADIRTTIDFRMTGLVTGAAVRVRGRWEPLGPTMRLDRSDLGNTRFRICPPMFWNGDSKRADEWAILEGNEFLGRPHRAALNLSVDFTGLGDALEITPGPYNASGYKRIRLSGEVVDSGEIQSVRMEGQTHELTLRHDIQMSSDHTIWSWPKNEEPRPVPLETCRWQGRVCTFPADKGQIVGYALSYCGERLGSVYPYTSAPVDSDRADWGRIAAWLRWWHAPVLVEPLRTTILRLARKQPAQALIAWLSDEIPLPVTQGDGRHVGCQLVRRFLWNWRPSSAEAAYLLVHLGLLTGDPTTDVGDGWNNWEQLLLSHPVLLVALALEGVPQLYRDGSPQEHRVLLLRLCNVILDLPPDASDGMRCDALNRSLATASTEMRVDVAFIWKRLFAEARALRAGEPVNSENLRIALAVQPLRRWIAARLLEAEMGVR